MKEIVKKSRHIKRSTSDIVFDGFVYTVMGLVLIACAYPLYFILIASVSDPMLISVGKVTIIPRNFSLDGYERIFSYGRIWTGYANTILYTVLGTAINLVCTITGGYALSRKDMAGRRIILLLIAFTMFFSGGMIPTYMLVRGLNMIDTIWAMVIPNAVQVWNLMIARSFFESTIPDELHDAASIDGCGTLRFFGRIVLPLSPAIISVMVLFYAISHWNAFFNAMLYLTKPDRMPLQLVLRDILLSNQATAMMDDIETLLERQKVAEILKYGVIVVASIPVLILYPFVQKYFVTGIMVGAIKG
jgi:putative aldouronate transport system permease protein